MTIVGTDKYLQHKRLKICDCNIHVSCTKCDLFNDSNWIWTAQRKTVKRIHSQKDFLVQFTSKHASRNPKDLWHTFLKARRTTRKCFLSSCQDICGVIFNPKIYFADFWNFKQGFWAWNWFKRVISGFRVCFFNNCIKKIKTRHTFRESFQENLQYFCIFVFI